MRRADPKANPNTSLRSVKSQKSPARLSLPCKGAQIRFLLGKRSISAVFSRANSFLVDKNNAYETQKLRTYTSCVLSRAQLFRTAGWENITRQWPKIRWVLQASSKGAKMSSKKLTKKVNADSFSLTCTSKVGGLVLLSSLQQSQGHQISAEVFDGVIRYVHGPVDQMRWKDLHIVFDAIKTAIVRSGLARLDLLKCEPYIATTGSTWNPGLELWRDDSTGQIFDMQKINGVIEGVLAGIKRDTLNDADDISMIALALHAQMPT